MLAHARTALLALLFLSLLTGVLYPLAVTGLAGAFFPEKAHGSLIVQNGRVVGSRLIGQQFRSPRYFWGRPSATGPLPYNGGGSSGSNLGPSNPALADSVTTRVAVLRAADPTHRAPVPIDLVTASGSGLDPDITPAGADYQVARVARARNLSEPTVRSLVRRLTVPRTLGLLGEPRVNVLALNRALDALP